MFNERVRRMMAGERLMTAALQTSANVVTLVRAHGECDE